MVVYPMSAIMIAWDIMPAYVVEMVQVQSGGGRGGG